MDDVIVVGAGPAGSNAALELAGKGHAVTVIDWRQKLGDKPCTGIVGRECIQRFPIDPSFIYREASSAQLVSPEDHCVQVKAENAQACIIDRVAYVASFAQRACTAGADYHLGHRVQQVLPDDQGVTILTDHRSYRARCVVLAAGFGSPLTRQLGLGVVPDHVSGIQALVATDNVEEVQVYLGQAMAPGFFSWLVPTEPGRALAGLLTRRRAQAHLVKFLQYLKSNLRVTEVIKEPACWGIPLRPLKRTYRDRVLVVGDAAGQVKPTTGGGIYYSLLASEIAADVLHEALVTGDLSSGTLSQYQVRWKTLLAKELETGYSARRLYEFLTDQQINSIVRQAGTKGFAERLVDSSEGSFDWHSQVIRQVIGHPAIYGVLKLVNPLLARFTPGPELSAGLAATVHQPADPLVKTPS